MIASAMVAGAGAASATAIQTLSFSGTLGNGSNGSGGPFGTGSYTNLQGDSYSVTLSYDPSLFTQSYSDDSCGAASGTSCYFTSSAANPVTEVLTVNGISETYVVTSGGFTLGSGPDNISFSFQNSSNLSLSGYFQAGRSLFPDQADVNDPIFSDFTNLSLASAGTFNESGNGFSVGANPNSLSASYDPASAPAVPEPASIALLGTGLFGLGFVRRRRRA